MKILIACEESQRVCMAFRERGHEAYSCDIKPCSGGFPEYHIQDDVLKVINQGWDMMIGHPPCTYISCAGACNFYVNGQRNEECFALQRDAVEFFFALWNAPIHRICLENPRPMKVAGLPHHSQVIYPELFGAKYSKQTMLWLKNLPPLIPLFTGCDFVPESLCAVHRSPTLRSKTSIEVAHAMAEQWNFNDSLSEDDDAPDGDPYYFSSMLGW